MYLIDLFASVIHSLAGIFFMILLGFLHFMRRNLIHHSWDHFATVLNQSLVSLLQLIASFIPFLSLLIIFFS